MEEKTVLISAINCGHCARTISSEIGDIEGVHSVEVDVAAKRATIRWEQPATWAKISGMLDEIGFPGESV